jgi:hypothetical protein
MKPVRKKDRLWLIIVPPLIALALISVIKPSGQFAFWAKFSIFGLCSLLCGFALALKQFKTVKHRIWGIIGFSAGGMYLICCTIFLGCFLPSGPPPSAAQIQQNLREREIAKRAWAAKRIVRRDALADSSMLDLSLYYDGVVLGPAQQPGSLLLVQKPGIHTWDGIKFDVRGTIGASWWVETNAIAVAKKCSEVYFLHGSHEGYPPALANQFFIHFQNGRTTTIPIVYGTDVSGDIFANSAVPVNAVVWEQMALTNAPPMFGGFFIKKWKNPFPDETITSIGFAPQNTGYLVAITIKESTNSSP